MNSFMLQPGEDQIIAEHLVKVLRRIRLSDAIRRDFSAHDGQRGSRQ